MKTTPTPHPQRLLTTREAAQHLQVSQCTVYRLTGQRKLAFYKIGGLLRFSEDDLNTFLETRRGATMTDLRES